MPLALLLLGVLFLVAAVRGKQDELFATLKSDFTGPKNFFYWGIALFIIGAIGYYKPLKPFSTAFLSLVILVLFFSNKGFPQSFLNQIGSTTSANQDSGLVIKDPLAAISRIVNEMTGLGVKI